MFRTGSVPAQQDGVVVTPLRARFPEPGVDPMRQRSRRRQIAGTSTTPRAISVARPVALADARPDARPDARRASTPGCTLAGTLMCALVAASTLFLASAAGAADRVRPERFTVYADVIDVQPVYRERRTSVPRRECWIEETRTVIREGGVAHGDRAYRQYRRHDRHRDPRYGTRHDTRHEARGGHGDKIVGGLIGGVVGNRLGRDASRSGRAGATIAGAIVGSAIANEASGAYARHRRHEVRTERRVERRVEQWAPRTVYETRPVERCRTVDTSRQAQRLQHYDVTYLYEGREFKTRLPRDPGPRLELNLALTPARR